eukprot:scaffold4503_cov167-Amphora_coffeaeformis.AAC.11
MLLSQGYKPTCSSLNAQRRLVLFLAICWSCVCWQKWSVHAAPTSVYRMKNVFTKTNRQRMRTAPSYNKKMRKMSSKPANGRERKRMMKVPNKWRMKTSYEGKDICLDISSLSGAVEPWFDDVIAAKNRLENLLGDPGWPAQTREDLEGRLTPDDIATSLPMNGVEDLYVAVKVANETLDGESGSVAQGGPRFITGTRTIVSGLITIDPADLNSSIADGSFFNTILHEFLHVVGVGTLWEEEVVGEDLIIDAPTATYLAPEALAFWNQLGCSGDLQLDSDLGHWDEDCLKDEIMTPTYTAGEPMIFSNITMAALEDIGYTVDRSQAESFTLADLGTCGDACPEAATERRLGVSTSISVSSTKRQLSKPGQDVILKAAVQFFRKEEERRLAQLPSAYTSSAYSVTYRENGRYHSHVILQSQVKHLL